MALPIINVPEYTITLPISNQKIKVRPFLVKEEKMLLTVMTSEDASEVVDILLQVLSNCTLDKVYIESLQLTDIEFLVLKLRGFSKGEKFDISIKCKNMVENKETKEQEMCGNVTNYNLDINDITVNTKGIKNDTIKLSDTIGIKLRAPRAHLMKELMGVESEIDASITGLIDCIESIWDGEEVMYTKDYKSEELEAFVDQLTSQQLKQIKEYIDSLPQIGIEVKHKCSKCENKETLFIRGIHDFLA